MRLGPFLILSAGLAGCASGSGATESTPAGAAPAASTTTSMARALTASLQPTNNAGNRIMGSVKLTPIARGYRAEIEMRNGGGAQNKYPWQIRPGTCVSATGDVIGAELAYKVLETTADGSARINAPVNIPTLGEGAYRVDILRSPSDRQTVVACGNLAPM